MSYSSRFVVALLAYIGACIGIVGCAGLEQPPYVEEDAKPKVQATCETPEQQKTEACQAAGGR